MANRASVIAIRDTLANTAEMEGVAALSSKDGLALPCSKPLRANSTNILQTESNFISNILPNQALFIVSVHEIEQDKNIYIERPKNYENTHHIFGTSHKMNHKLREKR